MRYPDNLLLGKLLYLEKTAKPFLRSAAEVSDFTLGKGKWDELIVFFKHF